MYHLTTVQTGGLETRLSPRLSQVTSIQVMTQVFSALHRYLIIISIVQHIYRLRPTSLCVCVCVTVFALTLSSAGSPGGAPWSGYMRGQVPGVLRPHTTRRGKYPSHCPRERGRRDGGRWPGRWSSQWSEVVPGGGHRCTQSAPADTHNSKVLYHWPFHGSCETNHCVCMLTNTAAGCLSEHTGEWEELTLIRHLAVVNHWSMVCMSVSHIRQCAQISILLLSSMDQWFVFMFIMFTSVFR